MGFTVMPCTKHATGVVDVHVTGPIDRSIGRHSQSFRRSPDQKGGLHLSCMDLRLLHILPIHYWWRSGGVPYGSIRFRFDRMFQGG